MARAMETAPRDDDDLFGRVAANLEPGPLLEATPECLVVTRRNGQIVYANHRVQLLTGFASDELVGGTIELLVATDLLGLPAEARVEALCRRSTGEQFPVGVNVGAIGAGEPLLVVTLRDLSELQAGRDAQFEAEAKYRALVEHIPAVVYLDPVDEDDTSIYVSPQIRDLIGIEPEEWLTDPYSWRRHVHPDDIDRAWEEYQEAYNGHTPLNHEYRMVDEDGTVRWVLEQAFPIDDENGNPWLIQGVIFDITERKNAEEQVAFLAYHDKLTGLPNRVLFEEMLENAIARARRTDGAVGVLYLDLDNFKMVNDTLGHHSGDLLLAQLADRDIQQRDMEPDEGMEIENRIAMGRRFSTSFRRRGARPALRLHAPRLQRLADERERQQLSVPRRSRVDRRCAAQGAPWNVAQALALHRPRR